jgi:putative methyltransferase (TIGR04325 family)
MEKEFNIWEGIFESFSEATQQAKGAGFNGDVYNTRVLQAAQECLAAIENGKSIPAFHKQRNIHLPTIVAMALANKSKLDVVDLGGGLGIGYMTLMESIPEYDKQIKYTVVEVNEVCEQGRALFSEKKGIDFINALPSKGSFNLVHSSSVMQYFENWKDVMKQLTEYDAEYISLADVFAGQIPTFVTLQNYYESKMKHWFLNLEDLLSYLSSLGYKLVMKTFVTAKRLNLMDTLPMDNFPLTHRLDHTLNLLFQRIDGGR